MPGNCETNPNNSNCKSILETVPASNPAASTITSKEIGPDAIALNTLANSGSSGGPCFSTVGFSGNSDNCSALSNFGRAPSISNNLSSLKSRSLLGRIGGAPLLSTPKPQHNTHPHQF